MKKAVLNWSTGKDAAYALYQIAQEGEYDIQRLCTTVQQEHNRVSMHGIRRELLLRQVAALDVELALDVVELPGVLSAEVYDELMLKQYARYRDMGMDYQIYGDILLEDLKAFRENQLDQVGLTGVFPLWNTPTAVLLKQWIQAGFKAVVVCVNERFLDSSFLGRTVDLDFLASLPQGVDPCGEQGEFHTFVFDGPIFKHPVAFHLGEKVHRTYDAPKTSEGETPQSYGFWFLDLL